MLDNVQQLFPFFLAARNRQLDKTNCNGKRGFTLLEVLVTIAIVAVLAALLIPALKGTLRRGKDAQCLSNLRQIGVAIRLASADNNRLIPTFTLKPGGGDLGSWAQNIGGYLGSSQDWTSNRVFLCPLDTRIPGTPYYNGYYASYGLNIELCANAEIGTNLAAVSEQSKTFLVMDVEASFGAHPTWGGSYNPQPRHAGRCNVVFVDGHVQALTPDEIKSAPFNWPDGNPETTTNAYRWK